MFDLIVTIDGYVFLMINIFQELYILHNLQCFFLWYNLGDYSALPLCLKMCTDPAAVAEMIILKRLNNCDDH